MLWLFFAYFCRRNIRGHIQTGLQGLVWMESWIPRITRQAQTRKNFLHAAVVCSEPLTYLT